MMLVYDDIWLREPNLLVPRRAPIGPVRIATGNPLARDLEYLIKPGETHDYVRGDRLVYGGAGSIKTDPQFGQGYYSDTTNGGYINSSATIADLGVDGTGPKTMFGFVDIRIFSDLKQREVIGIGGAGTNISLSASLNSWDDGIQLKVELWGDNLTSFPGDSHRNNRHVVSVIVTFEGTTVKSYYDGVYQGAKSRSLNLPATAKVRIAQDVLGTVKPHQGCSYLAGVFSRCLSDAEVKRLSDNPYQLFEAA